MDKEEVVRLLNQMQAEKWIKITNFENLTISLRSKLEKEVVGQVEEWIEEYTQLWHGKKSVDGYYLAQSSKENANRMVKFIQDNPQFTSDIILKATRKYISEKSLTGFKFAKKSHKFINDLDGSVLYGYALAIKNGEEEIKEKVEGI